MQLNLSSFSGKSTSAKSLRTQRGDFLIESLIGMVLMAIIGMGVVFVTSKMSTVQKDMRVQEIAVNQMRALLLNNGTGGINICNVAPSVKIPGVADSDVKTEVIGCNATVTATITTATGDVNIANVPKPLFISVSLKNEDGSFGRDEIIVGAHGS
jgi:Tfp pilus assembly protein PilX